MAASLAAALAEAPFACLVGSDCPGRTVADLAAAQAALAAGVDLVLGPVADGGYSLIGLRSPLPALFTDMPWGEATVAAETRRRGALAGRTLLELPLRRDVDRPEDLAALADELGEPAYYANPPAAR
jgi:hypothetical protein